MQKVPSQNIEEMVEEAFRRYADADLAGPEDIVIWGGQFAVEGLPAFLAAWNRSLANMPWLMIETVSHFEARRTNGGSWLPDDWGSSLERARLFGPSGDLDLRRDNGRFFWRFLGDPGNNLPVLTGEFSPRNYWDQPGAAGFRVVEEAYMQWRRNEGRVSEDWRGPGAELPASRFLRQRHYLQGGQTTFVRYLEFVEGAQR